MTLSPKQEQLALLGIGFGLALAMALTPLLIGGLFRPAAALSGAAVGGLVQWPVREALRRLAAWKNKRGARASGAILICVLPPLLVAAVAVSLPIDPKATASFAYCEMGFYAGLLVAGAPLRLLAGRAPGPE